MQEFRASNTGLLGPALSYMATRRSRGTNRQTITEKGPITYELAVIPQQDKRFVRETAIKPAPRRSVNGEVPPLVPTLVV